MGDGLKRADAAAKATQKHPSGVVLPNRGDGLHWLRSLIAERSGLSATAELSPKGLGSAPGKPYTPTPSIR